MKSKPIETKLLETECLFGETIEILDEYSTWIYCRLLSDNYHGWIYKKSVGYLKQPTHRVISIRTFLFTDQSEKSNYIHYLPLGAKLHVNNITNDWAEICLSDKHSYQIAYVPYKHIVKLNNKINDWVSVAEKLIGTPYKWGGKDTIGIDCSALVQLSYEAYGEIIPRNSIDQLRLPKKNIYNIKKLSRGFVVFWKGHVGIMVDKLHCIHANAYHMTTIVEPLKKIINRMNNENSIIKIMDFN